MNMTLAKKSGVTVLMLAILIAAQTVAAAPQTARSLPNPVLSFTGQEYLTVSGKEITRYHYNVVNKGEFGAELFAAATKLPPCGANTNASRTWVDIYDQSGKRLNGFCALGKPADLDGIWFALEADAIPPSWVYIELNDRQTNTKYKSNLAESVL